MKEKLILLLLFGLSLFGIQKSQRPLDEKRFQSHKLADRFYLPQKEASKAISLGYQTAFADILWVRTVLIYSDFAESCSPKDGAWLKAMLESVIHLDPTWRTAYYYGGSMLMVCDDVEGSDALFELGHSALPDDSFFPFSLSTNASVFHKDNEKALYWMKIAANSPNAAPWYSAAVAGLLAKEGDRRASIRYLREQLEEMEDPTLRSFSEERLRILIHDELEEQIEERRQRFIAVMGRNIQSVAELELEYPDPYHVIGGEWILAEDGRVRSSIIEEKVLRKTRKKERELLMRAQ